MVYIAPLPRNNQRQQQQPVAQGASRAAAAKADPQPQHSYGSKAAAQKQARNQRPADAKTNMDIVKSKQDLLQELTRQAEWNTLVLEREQAALRALQESQTGSLAAQASAHALAGAALGSSLDVMGRPQGLKPVAVMAKNHRFFDVAPKAVDPTQVPGLAASSVATAHLATASADDVPSIKACRRRVQGQQQQQPAAAVAKGAAAAGNRAAANRHSPVQQLQADSADRKSTVAAAAASRVQPQQQGRNAQKHKQQARGKAAAATAGSRLRPAAEAEADADLGAEAGAHLQEQNNGNGQLSPFADADWRFEYPGGNSPKSQAALNRTFPDSPQFRTGKVFEIPADAGLGTAQYTAANGGSPAAASRAAVAGMAYDSLAAAGAAQLAYAGAGVPLAQLVQQQQGQGWLGVHGSAMDAQNASHDFTSQQGCQAQQPLQPHLLLQGCHTQDDLVEALQVAQAYPDPTLRAQLVKELKQKQYKLELEQQIAEREAARQAAKAATAAREAAEEAARAAAPPPWDPAARAHRCGGGGEPLRSLDGAPVADLRAIKSRLPMPGAEASQTFGQHQQSQQQQLQQQPTLQLPAGVSSSQAIQPLAGPGFSPGAATSQGQNMGGSSSGNLQGLSGSRSPGVADGNVPGSGAGASIHQPGKGFMAAMNELKAGPSPAQRAAAAAARQQLQDDLQAQVAEKAVREAAEAAAEAARTAREEEALRLYYSRQQAHQNHQQTLNQQGLSAQLPNSQSWPGGVAGAGLSFGPGTTAGAQAMLQALAAEASTRALAAAGAPADAGTLPRKGRSKHVIEAPWLDQLQQQPVQQLQQRQQQAQQSSSVPVIHLDQQLQEQHLSSSHLQYTARQSLLASARAAAAGAAGSEQANSLQLATALQELQRQQALMWQEFSRQAQALEKLLADKQLAAADSNAAWEELQRVRGVLNQAQEQQQALQQMYADHHQQQQHRQQHQIKGRRDTQQQQQQQQHQYQYQQQASGLISHQHSTVQVNPLPQQPQQQQEQQLQLCHSMSDELPGDSLDAFMVETQLVPVTVNTIPDSPGLGDSLMQLMLPTVSTSQAHQAVQHHNRYGAYAPDAEPSSCSIASELQAKGSPGNGGSAVWAAWPNSQQQLSQRPPASPPILRSDRYADKPAEKQTGGVAAGEVAAHRQHQQKAATAAGSGGQTGRAAGKSRTAAAAGSTGKCNARRRI